MWESAVNRILFLRLALRPGSLSRCLQREGMARLNVQEV